MPDSIIDTGEKRINEAVCIDTKRIYGANAGRQRGHRQVPGLHH